MTAKKIIKAALLVFVASSMAFLAYQEFLPGKKDGNQAMTGAIAMETKTAGTQETSSGTAETDTPGHCLLFPYHLPLPHLPEDRGVYEAGHHGGFPRTTQGWQPAWKTVNVEEKGNEHFIKDYQLFSKAVVVVDMKDGKQVQWKNLKDIWQLVGKKDTFTRYIQDEVQSYLGKG